MRFVSRILAVAAMTFALAATPASAQLLGGVLGGGDGGGGLGGALGETVGGLAETVIGDNQGNGIVQQVVESAGLDGAAGNGQLLDLDTSGDGQVGVTGVLTAGVGGNGSVGGTLLGGGGGSVGLPLDGLLGGGAGVGIELPGGILGGGGSNGAPGAPGAAGLPGSNGIGVNGGNGGTNVLVFGGGRGGNGGAFHFNSSRLKMLARILQNRAWLRFAEGNKICLPQFGVANVTGWVKPSEYAGLQQLIAAYSGDIATLQQMMKRCRNGQNRIVDASRVIGVDLKDGRIVVMTM
jgi:hypothetical protein